MQPSRSLAFVGNFVIVAARRIAFQVGAQTSVAPARETAQPTGAVLSSIARALSVRSDNGSIPKHIIEFAARLVEIGHWKRKRTSRSKLGFYAVAAGRKPGIYSTWEECKAQVDGFQGNRHKKFSTRQQADQYLASSGVSFSSEQASGGQSLSSADYSTSSARPASAGALYSSGMAGSSAASSRPAAAGGLTSGTAAGLGSSASSSSTSTSLTSGPRIGPAWTQPIASVDFVLHFDGGARGNPGRGGSGSILYGQLPGGRMVRLWEHARYHPHCTNNEAEYWGLINGLQAAVELGLKQLTAKGDSKLIVEQYQGHMSTNKAHLIALRDRARSLGSKIPRLRLEHVYREANSEADAVGNRAADEGRDSTACYSVLEAFLAHARGAGSGLRAGAGVGSAGAGAATSAPSVAGLARHLHTLTGAASSSSASMLGKRRRDSDS